MKTASTTLLKRLFFSATICFSVSAVFAQSDSLPNTITTGYEQTHFDQQFPNDWRVYSVEYGHHSTWGTLLARVNQANRFARNGWQFEGEAYPVISAKLYAYAGLSYSSDVPVFAQWRTGSTLYYNFAKSWEAEGGFRYLYFDRNIWMGTAGVSKYLGPWLLNVRSFFSFQTPSGNKSFFLKAQRFLKNEKDFVWVQAGSGVSPDESRNVQLGTGTALQSKRIAAGAKLSISRQLQMAFSAGYARDEYRTKTFGHQYNGSVAIGYRF